MLASANQTSTGRLLVPAVFIPIRIRPITHHLGQNRNLYICDELGLISSMCVHHFRACISCEMTDFNAFSLIPGVAC